jgi:hypothetical protein
LFKRLIVAGCSQTYGHGLETKVSAVYNYSMMRGFPKDLLELYNVPVIEDLNYIIRKHERALDNSHPGLDAHCEFADRMYNYIRSKND